MTGNDKERLKKQTQKRFLLLRIKNGYDFVRENKSGRYIILAVYAAVIIFWLFCKSYFDIEKTDFISPAFIALLKLFFPLMIIAVAPAVLILLGTPAGSETVSNGLKRIGFTNSAGEIPMLISKETDEKDSLVTVYRFYGVGIPLKEWEDKRQRIEAALNLNIVNLKEGSDKQEIMLYAVQADTSLLKRIVWNDNYLAGSNSMLVLGKSLLGTVTVDLKKIPHILLGGSTGSGKSVLLKLLLMQALKKNMSVSIADFKGGVDFPSAWQENCKMCFDENELITLLTGLADELQRRKVLLRESNCRNIDEYCRETGKELKRCIFACDEIAEVLDKTGFTKEQKERVSLIESKLSVIARQGRAFGIHLILATQRPDAAILSGQIRNNIDCRICGRADNILSQIILDSTAAAEQIPKDTAGRFILYDGTVFQEYYFED